jgi:hypothetical protein
MDETTPLLRTTSRRSYVAHERPVLITSEHLVEFDPNGDPENPLDWPRWYKNFIVLLMAFMAFTV